MPYSDSAAIRAFTRRFGAGTPATMHITENYIKAFTVALGLLARHLPAAPGGGEISVTEPALHAVPALLEFALPLHALGVSPTGSAATGSRPAPTGRRWSSTTPTTSPRRHGGI